MSKYANVQDAKAIYDEICKMYGVDPNKFLVIKDFESVTITPCVKAKKAKD